MVNITADEYESGLYGDYAVKLTHQDSKNLRMGTLLALATLHMPMVHGVQEGEPQYYLEGPVGQVCPMLQEDGQCGIYEKRPLTCRMYSCVDDARITQEMRDGTVDIETAIMAWLGISAE